VDFEKGLIHFDHLHLNTDQSKAITKIFITACGTAYHVGMIGKLLVEKIARIPVEVDIASEFRYRDPIVPSGSVLLAISQSGETADTLAAMEEGKKEVLNFGQL